MEAVPSTIFRKNMKHYLDQLNDNSSTLLITNRNHADKNAVVMSQSDYDNLMENLYILSNNELVKKIKKGNAQVEAGKTKVHELIDD